MTATLGTVTVRVQFTGVYEMQVDQRHVVADPFMGIARATLDVAEDEIKAVVADSGLESADVVILGSEIVS